MCKVFICFVGDVCIWNFNASCGVGLVGEVDINK